LAQRCKVVHRCPWRPSTNAAPAFQSYAGEIVSTVDTNIAQEEDPNFDLTEFLKKALGGTKAAQMKSPGGERGHPVQPVIELVGGLPEAHTHPEASAEAMVLNAVRAESSVESSVKLEKLRTPNRKDPLHVEVLKFFSTEAPEIVQPSLDRPAEAFAENEFDYFKQYSPYILENVQQSLVEQVEYLVGRNLQPHRAKVVSVKNGKEHVKVVCEMPKELFPRLDHFFSCEMIAVRHPGADQLADDKAANFVLGYSGNVDGSKVGLEGFKPHWSQQYFDIKMRKSDYEKLRELYATKSGSSLDSDKEWGMELEWHHLTGLIPAERMYAACEHIPRLPAFLPNLLRRQPEAWPTLDAATETGDPAARLNDTQRSVIARLTSNEAQGLYNLIGPPGTGKTHTVVHLLAERVRSFPTEKILLTAPSNKAVHVVLGQLLNKIPNPPLVALSGVLGVVPPHLEEIYASEYTKCLKRLLVRAFDTNEPIEVKTAALKAAYAEVDRRLTRLSTVEGCRVRNGKAARTVEELVAKVSLARKHFEWATPTTDKELRDHPADLCELLDSAHTGHLVETYLQQKAQVLFCTLVSSGRDSLRKVIGDIDCVMVDEAAQAIVPETFIPLQFNPRLFVLIGDPQQLRGTVSHSMAKKGFAESLMGLMTEKQQRPYLERLTTQYRMHPSICKWVSDQFYDGELVADGTLRERDAFSLPSTMALSGLPSAFIDVSGEEQKGEFGSIQNAREANVIVATVKYLLNHGVDPKSIGVLAYYSSQARLLREKMAALEKELIEAHRKKGGKSKRITALGLVVSTVDGFQGDERDFVLISCVRSVPSVGFLNDHRRINVAMSRAKHARWVFGRAQPLSKSNSSYSHYFYWMRDASQNTVELPTKVVPDDVLLASMDATLAQSSQRSRSQPSVVARPVDAPAKTGDITKRTRRAAAVPGVKLLDAYQPLVSRAVRNATPNSARDSRKDKNEDSRHSRPKKAHRNSSADPEPTVKASDFEMPQLDVPEVWW
jgi:hypothetical protein